jgi:hypothetical protein
VTDAIYLLCCTPESLPQGIDGKLPNMMHLENLSTLGLACYEISCVKAIK